MSANIRVKRGARMRTRPIPDAITIMERVCTLSAREVEVMRAIAHGEPPQKTARRLELSAKTVNVFRSRVKRKLQLTTNADIAIAAYKAGFRGDN